ncbi:MAG: chalcone isomerase family protein [Gemmatimonadales bacterium]
MPRSMMLFAALALAPALSAAQGPQSDSVVEPKSKRAFPVMLEVAGGSAAHILTGTAIRTKTILKVKVYAYGLYVDADAARDALTRWRGLSAAELAEDDAFYAALLEDNIGKTLRLVMTRDVGGEDMAEAFDDALAPRIEAYDRDHGTSGGLRVLEQFRSYFNLEELTKETELVFTCLPGGRLVTSVAGSVRGELESPALCWALFDVYLGENPIMKKGKETVVERMPGVLGG